MWVSVCVCVSAGNVYARVCKPRTVSVGVGVCVCANAEEVTLGCVSLAPGV